MQSSGNRNAEYSRNFFDLSHDISASKSAALINWTGNEHNLEQVDYSREYNPHYINHFHIALNRLELQLQAFNFVVRPKIIKAAKERLKDSLRSYMLRPVIRSVEMDESLEHLTEMRQVVILFINIITTVIDNEGLISLVNAAYKIVCR